MCELNHILLPLWMAVYLFFTWPGRFGSRNLHFGIFRALFIDIPDGLVDSAKCASWDAAFLRTGTTAQRCAYAKCIDSRTSLQEFRNLPLIKIAAGKDAHTRKVCFVKLFPYILAIGNDVAAIQAY